MIRLKAIVGAGFRSFAQPFEILDLPDTGLVSFSGRSGAGKSSCVKAISYVLNTMSDTASQQASWLTNAQTMNVQLQFARSDSTFEIRRGEHKSFLSGPGIEANGAKALNSALPDFFGMDAETLALITYRAQRQYGSFLAKSDIDKKSTLWTLLNLSQYENALEKLKTDHLATKRDTDQLTTLTPREPGPQPALKPDKFVTGEQSFGFSQDEESAFVQSLEDAAKASVGPQPLEGLRLEELQKELGAAQGNAARVEAETRAEYQTSIKNGTPDLVAARQALQTVTSELATAKTKKAESDTISLRTASTMNKMQMEATRLTEQEEALVKKSEKIIEDLKAFDVGVCPTCTQPWQNVEEEQKLRKQLWDIEAKLQQIYEQKDKLVADAPAVQEAYKQAEVDCGRYQNELWQVEECYKQAKNSYDAFEGIEKERQSKLYVDVFEPRLNLIKGEFEAIKQDYTGRIANAMQVRQQWLQQEQRAASIVQQTKLEYKLASDAYRHSQQLFEIWERENETYRQHIEKVKEFEKKTSVLSDSREVLQGFLDRVVQDVLAEINDVADRLMALVPNVSRMSLVLGVREKRGRAEIAADVSVDGQVVSVSQLSGGQQSVVELLTDLAIWEVVSRYRGGEMPGWLVLDEPFDGISGDSIEACLDILERYAQNRLIICIHHATEFRQRFSRIYEFENGVVGSTVRMAS